MKILVTGGTGYIGSHTVVELQQKGFDVVIVDALFNSRIQALDAIESVTGIRPEFESFDLADKASFRHQRRHSFRCSQGSGRISG